MKAVSGCNKIITALLIDAGADLNSQNNSGWTPLHATTWSNSEYFVQLLIKAGANLNVKNICMGETALHIAAHYNKFSIANLLIGAGADLAIKDHNGLIAEKRVGESKKRYEMRTLFAQAQQKNNKLKSAFCIIL